MDYLLLEDGLSKLDIEGLSSALGLEYTIYVPPSGGPTHSERVLEDFSYRLLEDNVTDRALELSVPVTPSLSGLIYGGHQNELPFLRCNVCSRKSYQIKHSGMICNAYNSAPSKYPLQYCPGILVPSVLATIPQLNFQLFFQERASK